MSSIKHAVTLYKHCPAVVAAACCIASDEDVHQQSIISVKCNMVRQRQRMT
jgi:hypothetical protein